MAQRMPFALRAIQVDGGSEFMADFEAECAQRRIALFVLPPRSPKLNGHVERANGTHTAEFWEVTDAEPEYEPLREAMLAWETCYNTVRPHQALGYLTPPNGSHGTASRPRRCNGRTGPGHGLDDVHARVYLVHTLSAHLQEFDP